MLRRLALFALLVTVPVSAAEPHRYLPDDTELLVSVSIKQLLATKLLKDQITDALKDALANSDEAKEFLKELGFDPFRDLHNVLVASPGSVEADRGLIIVQGEFDVAKFKAKGAALEKNKTVKVHTVAEQTIYEFTLLDQQNPWFLCVPAKDAVLISAGKDYIVDAIKRNPLKNPVALKSKTFAELLEKVDDKQSLYLAGTADALGRSGLGTLIKDYVQKADSLAGGIKLDDDLQLEIVIGAKTLADAKALTKSINDLSTQGLLILGLLATQQEELRPAVDVLKSVRCVQKEKVVALKARVEAELLQQLLPRK